jgi:hypothetical protein
MRVDQLKFTGNMVLCCECDVAGRLTKRTIDHALLPHLILETPVVNHMEAGRKYKMLRIWEATIV